MQRIKIYKEQKANEKKMNIESDDDECECINGHFEGWTLCSIDQPILSVIDATHDKFPFILGPESIAMQKSITLSPFLYGKKYLKIRDEQQSDENILESDSDSECSVIAKNRRYCKSFVKHLENRILKLIDDKLLKNIERVIHENHIRNQDAVCYLFLFYVNMYAMYIEQQLDSLEDVLSFQYEHYLKNAYEMLEEYLDH